MTTKSNPVLQSRRQVLKTLAAGCALPLLPACNFFTPPKTQYWLSAAGAKQQDYALAWSSPSNTSQNLNTPFRGHGLAQHPNKPHQAIMVSRRPGNEGVVLDIKKQSTKAMFKSPDHLFMEGHACFNHNADLLYCSESNRHNNNGVISIRESKHYTMTKELSSGGIGPHEILLHPTQKNTLVIANGGLIKNESGEIVNGDTLESNISFLDLSTGQIKQRFYSSEKKASLRHMDISQDGIIAVAIQMQRKFANHQEPTQLTALIKDDKFTPLIAPKELLLKMKDYVGSVRINNKHRTVAFTSPKGDLALFWNIDSGKFLGQHYFHNVCGLTVSLDEKYFVLSNSAGKIRHIKCDTLIEQRDLRQYHPQYQWDNHMLTLAG